MEKKFPTYKFPKRLTIEFTNCCNLECTMCPRHSTESDLGYMSLALYNKIIEEARQQTPVALVPFFRGESLLHPKFFEMIEIARRSGIAPIQLATNATLLNDRISTNLIKSGIDFISFSLDIDKNNYETTHIRGNYEKVIGNIEDFIAIREQMTAKKPEIQISTVETTENRHGMHAFVEHWINKVERVRVYPQHSGNGAYGQLRYHCELPNLQKRLPCKKVFTDMVIYWDGTVAICNHDWSRKEYIGNVCENSIQEIWVSNEYEEIRNRHLEGKLENDQTCKDCDHWKMYYIEEGSIGMLYEKQDKVFLN